MAAIQRSLCRNKLEIWKYTIRQRERERLPLYFINWVLGRMDRAQEHQPEVKELAKSWGHYLFEDSWNLMVFFYQNASLLCNLLETFWSCVVSEYLCPNFPPIPWPCHYWVYLRKASRKCCFSCQGASWEIGLLCHYTNLELSSVCSLVTSSRNILTIRWQRFREGHLNMRQQVICLIRLCY